MNIIINIYLQIQSKRMMLLLLPILYILYLNSVCEINGQNKQCTNCKYFIPHKNSKITSLGLCKMFGNKVYSKNNEKHIYNFAQNCRDDESLCGKNATFYEEQKNNTYFVQVMEDEMLKAMINDYYNFLRNENDW